MKNEWCAPLHALKTHIREHSARGTVIIHTGDTHLHTRRDICTVRLPIYLDALGLVWGDVRDCIWDSDSPSHGCFALTGGRVEWIGLILVAQSPFPPRLRDDNDDDYDDDCCGRASSGQVQP